MPRLTIPDRHRVPMTDLFSLPEPQFAELVSALQQFAPKPDSVALADLSVPSIEKKQLRGMLRAIGALYAIWAAVADKSPDEFAEDVLSSALSLGLSDNALSARNRVRQLLGAPSLLRASKAESVLTDHQRIFENAKVLSDIRFAFQADPEAEPYGAVLVHVLKLTYHEHGEHKEFYLALDGEDLESVKKAIDRARSKTKNLLKKLSDAQVPYLGKGDK